MPYTKPVQIQLYTPKDLKPDTPKRLQIEIGVLTETNPILPLNPFPVQLDTGSCGGVVNASFFFVDGKPEYDSKTQKFNGQLLDGIKLGGRATVHYQPSNADLHGWTFTVPKLAVGLKDGGACAIASNVKMIGVVDEKNSGPHMLGIGFGRPNPTGTNPFLGLSSGGDSGDLYPSFTLNYEQVWLGIQPEEDALKAIFGEADFGMTILDRQSPSDNPHETPLITWNAPVGQFEVDQIFESIKTDYSILFDTGVDLMMLNSKSSSTINKIAGNSIIDIYINGTDDIREIVKWCQQDRSGHEPDIDNPIFAYTFTTVGKGIKDVGGDPTTYFQTSSIPIKNKQKTPSDTPPSAILLRGNDQNFINIGLHPLANNIYYYDGLLGIVGFASTGN